MQAECAVAPNAYRSCRGATLFFDVIHNNVDFWQFFTTLVVYGDNRAGLAVSDFVSDTKVKVETSCDRFLCISNDFFLEPLIFLRRHGGQMLIHYYYYCMQYCNSSLMNKIILV